MSSEDGREFGEFAWLMRSEHMMYADVAVRPAPDFGAFVGRNREGRSGARTAFDVASGLLGGVVARVLG